MANIPIVYGNTWMFVYGPLIDVLQAKKYILPNDILQ